MRDSLLFAPTKNRYGNVQWSVRDIARAVSRPSELWDKKTSCEEKTLLCPLDLPSSGDFPSCILLVDKQKLRKLGQLGAQPCVAASGTGGGTAVLCLGLPSGRAPRSTSRAYHLGTHPVRHGARVGWAGIFSAQLLRARAMYMCAFDIDAAHSDPDVPLDMLDGFRQSRSLDSRLLALSESPLEISRTLRRGGPASPPSP